MHRSMRRTKSVGVGPEGSDPMYDARNRYPGLDPSRSSHQLGALLRQPQAVERPEAPGVRVKPRRAKRFGYTHTAALPGDPDLLTLPNGGCHVNPLTYFNTARMDPFAVPASAGISSDKQDKMMDWIDDLGVPTVKPVYYPSNARDPITHKVDPSKCTVERDATLVQGAAGVGTQRLNTLATGIWLAGKLDSETVPRPDRIHLDHDIIKHVDAPPEQPKPMKKMADSVLQRSRVTTMHRGGIPAEVPPEEYMVDGKQKLVKSGDKYLVFVAGNEDLAPAATENYTKADRPPTRAHKLENDKKYLHGFDGLQVKRGAPFGGNPRQLESNDMDYIMGGRKDSTVPYDGCKNPTGDTRWGGTNYPVPYPQGYPRSEEGNRTSPSNVTTRSLQAPRVIPGVYPDGQRARSMPKRPSTARQASKEGEGYPRESERRRQRSSTPPRGDYAEMFDRTKLKSSKGDARDATDRTRARTPPKSPKGYAPSSGYSPRRSQASLTSGVSADSRARYGWAS